MNKNGSRAQVIGDSVGVDTGISRRRMLATAGAVGVGAVLGPAVVPGTSLAAEQGQSAGHGSTNIEFVGQVIQRGTDLVGAAYLTFVRGLDPALLFTDPQQRDESTARLGFFGIATMTARSILQPLFVLNAEGEIAFFFRPDGGASFADPTSFADGERIATHSLRIQSILNVIAADRGIPTLTGELSQRTAEAFAFGGRPRRIGHPNLGQRFNATGQAVRTDPNAPDSTSIVAGWIA
jgi:hypothetical protein